MLKRLETRIIRILGWICYIFVTKLVILIFSCFFRIKIEGKENIPKRGRFILAANHQNFFDGFFLSYVTHPFKRVSFVVAKRSLRLRIFRLIMRMIGSVVIDNKTEDYQRALKSLNRILIHGGAVGIFPEGNISAQKIPGRFKGGVVKLSFDSKTKVIPVCIMGTFNLRYFWYWLKRPQILLRVGKPLDLYNYVPVYGNNLEQTAFVLRREILELMGLKESEESEFIIDSKPLVSVYKEPLKETVN